MEKGAQKMQLVEGERGFSLVDTLVTVGILGIISAVAIVNLVRFTDSGEVEAAETELHNIQTVVSAMMVDNYISTLPNPVTTPTNDMGAFPDETSIAGSTAKQRDPNGNNYNSWLDKSGYVLFGHDIIGGDGQNNLVNYVATRYAKGTYTVDENGTVKQETTGY